MTHSRFELGFTRHRKVHSLGDAAFRLWVSSVDYAREQCTDGTLVASDLDVIPRCPPRGRKRDTAVAEIVAAGLWEPTPGGWAIHDFLDWQDAAERVRTKRERARARMRRVRANIERTFAGCASEVPGREKREERRVEEEVVAKDLTGSARWSPSEAATASAASSKNPEKFAMHPSWEPDPATLASFEVAMIPEWAVKKLVAAHRSHFCAAKTDIRTEAGWNQSCSKWVHGDWNNQKKRPKRDAPTTEDSQSAEGWAT